MGENGCETVKTLFRDWKAWLREEVVIIKKVWQNCFMEYTECFSESLRSQGIIVGKNCNSPKIAD